MNKGILEQNISLNFNAVDELQLGIMTLHCSGQSAFEGTIGILNEIKGVYGEIPFKARNQGLLSVTEALLERMRNYSCMEKGQMITGKIQNLAERLYEIEERFAGKILKAEVYFSEDKANIFLSGDKLGKETERKTTEKKAEQFIAQYLEDNILDGVNYKIDISGLSQRDKNRIYVTDMENYLWRNSGWAIQTYYAPGVPTSVRIICKNKMEKMMNERAETYEQASELKGKLMSIDDSDYVWSADFLTAENSIKLIDIFERHNVDDAEHRANFLAQICKESGGGRDMRESLKFNNDDDCERFESLIDTYDLKVAEQYVLSHPKNYLSTQQSEGYLAGNSKEQFIDVISRPYNTANKEEVINFYYSSNNLPGKENGDSGKELAAYIGSGVDSPFQISDLVLYRGGGCMQITAKENYYRFAYYIETEFHDTEAANDIRKNGCYSQYVTDTYCLESAEWYYFEGPNRVNEGDSSEEITGKVYGKQNSSRNSTQEVIQNALENK